MATTNQLAAQNQSEVTAAEQTASSRFTAMVMKEYRSITGGGHEFTNHEKQLIRNYFVVTDQALAKCEADRLRKNAKNSDHAKYDNNLPYSWQNVNLPALAKDLAHYARMGLDMMADNYLFPIPYKDNKNNVYSITLMEGYNGIKYQAVKYALTPWKSVTVEVIYQNDKFRPIKRDSRNPVEGYEFDIPQPFNRGDIVGVFGYIAYADPTMNKLVVFSTADVMKRKPKYASAEFWDGWTAEMYEKTMKREIYGSKHIPRDPDKIDESYHYVQMREQQYADFAAQNYADKNANQAPVMLPPAEETPQKSAIEVTPIADEAPKQPDVTPAETADDDELPDFLQ